MKRLVIIPAAGLATRMMPLSASMSKAMIPVVGKPILAHIIDNIHDYVDHIIVVHGMHDDIPDFLKKKDYHKVSWCKQDEHDGPLGAIWSGIDYFKKHNHYNDENYYTTIWLGDTLINGKEAYKRALSEDIDSNTAQLAVAKVDDWSRWCLISEDAYDIIDKPIEKPDTNNALIGVYKLNYDFPILYQVIGMLVSAGEEEIKPLLESFSDETRNIIDFTEEWVDCGDLPSLYKANSTLISSSARANTSIKIHDGIISKTTNNFNQEYNWYKSVSENEPKVLPMIPQFYGETDYNTYSIELCSGHSLQDLVLYHNINRKDVWENILRTVLERANTMHDGYYYSDYKRNNNETMFYENISSRIIDSYDNKILDTPNFSIIADFLSESYKMYKDYYKDVRMSRVINGDMHFANIFFDASTDKVKFIDPRGKWGNQITTHGHRLYDIAKLYQSVLCKYCHISADEKLNQKSSDLYTMLENILDNELLKYYDNTEIKIAKRYAILLLASAIPCHFDNPVRQHIMKNKAVDLITSGKY